MRIHRIAIRDFRGVSAADIELAPDGVTIVQGPNEVGKSTIADAVDMLLADPDSSSKARVKAAQPLGRDVGPWVEMEFDTGPYRLVYSKRWVKGAATELTVRGPHDEQHTGRGAHDRVEQILAETLDAPLFSALRHQQGMPLDQADLGASSSLARALDMAAGAGSASDDDALVDRIDDERLRWSTPGGAANKARVALRVAADDAQAAAAADLERLRSVEARVDDHRRITREVAANEEREPAMRERVRELDSACAEMEAHEAAVRELGQLADAAEAEGRAAGAEMQAREALAHAVEQSAARVAAVRAEAVVTGARAQEAEESLQQACGLLADAVTGLRAAEDALVEATALADRARDGFDLELLVERREQVHAAEQRIASCEAYLEQCRISAELMQAIEDAATDDAMARGRLQASGVGISLTAARDLDLTCADGPRAVTAGSRVEMPLAPGDELVLDGIASIALDGHDAGARDAASAAAERLAQALSRAGLGSDGDIAAARAMERERQDRARELAAARDARARALRDLTIEEMDAKIERARHRAAAHAGTGQATSPEQAQARRTRCEVARDDARRAEAVARAAHADAEARARDARAAQAQCEGRLGAEEQRLADEQAALDDARQQAGDDALRARAMATTTAAVQARERHAEQAAALERDDPESLRLRAANARDALERLLGERGELTVRAAQVEGEIRQAGEEGLADRAARASEHARDTAAARDRVEREAAAADLLHAVMTQHLDAARRAYVAPFRDEVERLSRLVFGPGTSVEVDHATLRVVSRTRDGVTVPYEALSGGAREQLAVIGRLAAASLVASDGGAPVIIDDALGYSDPGRLEGLGAALASAGRAAQVIVLTCMPDRYAGIGLATVVRMEPRTAAAGDADLHDAEVA